MNDQKKTKLSYLVDGLNADILEEVKDISEVR